MSNFETSVPVRPNSSIPDWLADEFEAILDEFASRTQFHTPVVVSVANGVQYAICANCDQNVESWLDDETLLFGNFGVRVEFANGAMLDKVCRS
jgi:hypothetical protein